MIKTDRVKYVFEVKQCIHFSQSLWIFLGKKSPFWVLGKGLTNWNLVDLGALCIFPLQDKLITWSIFTQFANSPVLYEKKESELLKNLPLPQPPGLVKYKCQRH